MYTRGTVVGGASIICTDISPTPPLIFTGGQKVRFLLIANNARVCAAVVWKPSKISSPFLNLVCGGDLEIFPQSLVQMGPRVFKTAPAVLEHPLKTDEKSVVNRQQLSRRMSDLAQIWNAY